MRGVLLFKDPNKWSRPACSRLQLSRLLSSQPEEKRRDAFVYYMTKPFCPAVDQSCVNRRFCRVASLLPPRLPAQFPIFQYRTRMNISRFAHLVEHNLAKLFGLLGLHIARRPVHSIVLCLVIAAACCTGLGRIKSETSATALYTPDRNNRAEEDGRVYDSLFSRADPTFRQSSVRSSCLQTLTLGAHENAHKRIYAISPPFLSVLLLFPYSFPYFFISFLPSPLTRTKIYQKTTKSRQISPW